MKISTYIIISACLIMTSCNSDGKSKNVEKVTNTAKTTTTSDDGPVFTMVDKNKSSVKVALADTIEINAIEDIVHKANHNTALRLKKGKYKLASNLVYYISKDKNEIVDKNKIVTRSVGGQIYISGMTNFSIMGNGSTITSDNPKATPLFIHHSEEGKLQNLIINKSNPTKQKSKVPSLYITGSNKMVVEKCTIGKGDRIGLKINNSKFLSFDDCTFSGANEKIIEVIKGKSIVFNNSTFNNNSCLRGCLDFLGTENSVEFKNALIKNNNSVAKSSTSPKMFITGPSQNVFFRSSKFIDNSNFDEIGIEKFNLSESEVQKF